MLTLLVIYLAGFFLVPAVVFALVGGFDGWLDNSDGIDQLTEEPAFWQIIALLTVFWWIVVVYFLGHGIGHCFRTCNEPPKRP